MSNMTFATTITSRTDCENFLRDRKERKLTYETWVKRAWNNQRDYVVTHHGSDIARFNHVGDQLWAASYQVMRDGHPLATEIVHTIFDNCGWSSPTTVGRLHEMIPDDARGFVFIGRKDGGMEVRDRHGFAVRADRVYFGPRGRTFAEAPDGRMFLIFEGLDH